MLKSSLDKYSDTVFRKVLGKTPPIRRPLGVAKIKIKSGYYHKEQKPFQLAGERRDALIKLVQGLIEEGKIEKGISAWSSPAFPVPKKNPGEWRMVIDYRQLNDATENDGHPLPRIDDILNRQGKHKIWTVLDLKDGFHQVPIDEGSRHYTCMSTP